MTVLLVHRGVTATWELSTDGVESFVWRVDRDDAATLSLRSARPPTWLTVRSLIDEAIRTSMAMRGPVYVQTEPTPAVPPIEAK